MASSLSREEVLKVATLARLRLSEAEVDTYTDTLGRILEYFGTLNEVDTDDVEPMAHAVEMQNVFREDAVLPSLPRSDALSNAPKSDGQFFLVPQILDGA